MRSEEGIEEENRQINREEGKRLVNIEMKKMSTKNVVDKR